jgi:hypothetical protein
MRHNRAVRTHLDEDAEVYGEDAAADDLELHSWHSRHGSRRMHQPAAHAARAAAVDIDVIDEHRDGRLRFAAAESGADAAAEAEAQAAREMDMAAAGVDVDDEPLQAQILSQKRLATYYGEVHLGDQPFKGACKAGEAACNPGLSRSRRVGGGCSSRVAAWKLLLYACRLLAASGLSAGRPVQTAACCCRAVTRLVHALPCPLVHALSSFVCSFV